MKQIRVIIMMMAVLALVLGQTEAIEVRSPSGDFEVSFEPIKPVYKTGERIQFKIKGNKTFYLYLFSIDPRENRGYVILPNTLQEYNKYKADREYMVPEKEVEFVSEQPGTEKIIMIASTKKLKMKLEKYTKAGNFFSSEAATVDEEVKALSIWSSEKEQKIVKEISLVIVGQGQIQTLNQPQAQPAATSSVPAAAGTQPSSAGNTAPGAATFVSSDKISYRSGEIMKITFGADKNGFVYLFAIEPDGKRTFLTRQMVSGQQFYQVRGKATLPAGEHTLVAVYDEQGNLDTNAVSLPEPGQKTKGIELIGDTPAACAVYHLTVYE